MESIRLGSATHIVAIDRVAELRIPRKATLGGRGVTYTRMLETDRRYSRLEAARTIGSPQIGCGTIGGNSGRARRLR